MDTDRDNRIILLNYDYLPLTTISWKRALKLMVSGKAEPVGKKYFNLKEIVKTVNSEYIVPKVLRLMHMINKIHKNKVQFSKRSVLLRDNFKCAYCGINSKKLTIDHVIPRSRGGSHTYENTVACCLSCNMKKGDKTPTEANMELMVNPTSMSVFQYIQRKFEDAGIYEIMSELCSTSTA